METRYSNSKKKTTRSRNRADFKVKRTVWTDVACGVLAFITTVLIWLYAG